MMAQGQLPIAPFCAGARPLKELSAFGGYPFNESLLLQFKHEKRTLHAIQRRKQMLRLMA